MIVAAVVRRAFVSVQFPGISAPERPAPDRAARSGAAGSLAPALALLPESGPQHPRWVVFGSDHGTAALGVSRDDGRDTGRRLSALAAGTGPLSALAGATGVPLRPVDLREPAPDDPDNAWGGHQPSSRIDILDALSGGEVVAAVDRGSAVADAEADAGADLLVAGVCSVAASTSGAVLAAAITGLEPVDATSRGGGIDDAAWIRKVAVVRDSLYRARLAGTDAVTLLRVSGGSDLAALTGFLAQAAARRVPVLLAGGIAVACGVLAHRLAPGADAWMIPVGPAPVRGHARLLDVLGRPPVPGPDGGFGSGSAGALLVPTLRALAAAVAVAAPVGPRWDPTLL